VKTLIKVIAVLIGLVTVLGITQPPALAAPRAAATFNVKDYGAKGDGEANDTSAINKAITAASAASGTVEFPKGTFRSAGSIHLKSNITVQLDSGSTIKGASGTGYDKPESNAYDS
jgi:polygalacturonase